MRTLVEALPVDQMNWVVAMVVLALRGIRVVFSCFKQFCAARHQIQNFVLLLTLTRIFQLALEREAGLWQVEEKCVSIFVPLSDLGCVRNLDKFMTTSPFTFGLLVLHQQDTVTLKGAAEWDQASDLRGCTEIGKWWGKAKES